jgi:hypothetical protein
MRFAAIVPVLIFLVVCTTVGVRLLLLARRTRQIPELAIGLGLVLISLFGMPCCALGRMPRFLGTGVGNGIFSVGAILLGVGISLFFVFTWSVFRRGSRWAAALVIASSLALLVIPVGQILAGSQGSSLSEILPRTRPWAVALVAMLALAFAWGGLESLRYYRMLRRRLALGLADPVIANRFLLWTLAGGSAVLLCAYNIAFLLAGSSVIVDTAGLYTVAVTGSMLSATWYLTFLPPEAYLRLVRRRFEARAR